MMILLPHTHTRLTALCPGLPRRASTRKVKPIWILLKQETVGGSGISWAIMQVCTSLQTDNHTSTPPLLCFLQAGCPSCRPTNSVKALKAKMILLPLVTKVRKLVQCVKNQCHMWQQIRFKRMHTASNVRLI